MRVALAGNPNSGKTSMYNALTGKNEKVGNWAGVTVDKRESTVKKKYIKSKRNIFAVDLPGAYSMSPFTSEESITSSYIKNENPDVIINIVDATNLSRSLFFTTQLLELGIPVVVALNKSDVNDKKGNTINTETLSEILGCPVIETVSTNKKGKGLSKVIKAAEELKGQKQTAPYVQANIELLDKEEAEAADRKRFDFVNKIVSKVEVRKTLTNKKNSQDKIDAVLTNKWLGIPIFAVIMYLVFWISQSGPGAWIAEGYEFESGVAIPGLVTLLESFQSWIGGFFQGASPLLYALLIDGVIGGAIAVVGFLPLVMVMYFLIALLEDCGYMARATVVLDPIFKRVGLSGKSVIPFVVATGCAIPGVMASRTIRSERERRAAAMLAPFMPCGAKLPVIALFSGAFFRGASWVGPLMYFLGIVIIFIGALIVNRVTGNKAKKAFFIIELPEYKTPSFSKAVGAMISRGWSYVVKAATIILLCNTAVQIMQTFDWTFAEAATADSSILASVAEFFAYLLIPVVGFHAWQLAAATVTGFIAKENVVGTLAVCYALTDITQEFGGAVPELTASAALAFLMLNLFSPPCFAAIGAMNAEMKSAKWLWGGIGLQLGVGYTVGYFVYQIGTLITIGQLGAGAAAGLVAVIVFFAVVAYLIKKADKEKNTRHVVNQNKIQM